MLPLMLCESLLLSIGWKRDILERVKKGIEGEAVFLRENLEPNRRKPRKLECLDSETGIEFISQ